MLEYFKITIVCSVLVFSAIPSSAEFYQYVDSKGITHFTDKFSTIPAKYQSQVDRHHEEIIALPDEVPYPEYEDPQPIEIKSKTPKISGLKKEKSMLLDKKKAMNQQFEMLMVEKQQIESSKENVADKKGIITYNRRVKEINKKIRQYKEEENRFQSEIERYNKSISSLIDE